MATETAVFAVRSAKPCFSWDTCQNGCHVPFWTEGNSIFLTSENFKQVMQMSYAEMFDKIVAIVVVCYCYYSTPIWRPVLQDSPEKERVYLLQNKEHVQNQSTV